MRWQLAARLGVALALLAAAGLAGAIWWLGSSGEKAYERRDWALAATRYTAAEGAMPFESWKAAFGEGTAMLAAGVATRAEVPLARALETVPDARQCLVRTNLSLAQEWQGDGAAALDDWAGAVERWEAALATLREGDCPAQSQVAAEAERRLEEKLQSSETETEPETEPETETSDDPSSSASPSPGGSGSPGSGSPSPSPSQSDAGGSASGSPSPGESGQADQPSVDPNTQRKLDRLEDLNEEARRERGDDREYEDSRNSRRDSDTPIW
jgi:hypothetical protein